MLDNTTINITVKNNNNQIIAGASIIINIAGIIYNLITDNTGAAVATLSLSNITIANIEISALGFLTNYSTYTINPINNVFTFVLSIDTSQINTVIQVLDVNNLVVPNVLISVNGKVVGRTDQNGSIPIIAPAGQITLQTSLIGYKTFILSGQFLSNNFPSRIVITPTIARSKALTIQTSPNTLVVITDTARTTALDTITTDSYGFGTTTQLFLPGTYNVTLSKPNCITVASNINVTANISEYSLELLQTNINIDPGFTPQLSLTSLPVIAPVVPSTDSTQLLPENYGVKRFGAAAPTVLPSNQNNVQVSTGSRVNTGGTSELEYPSEWIYPNAGNGRYLTGSQARIYIGNVFIDEIDTLYYVYNNNRIPVYGYSSANVDAFGQGKRIVQGQIALNFVSEGYLYTVLNEYSKKNLNNNLSPAEAVTANQTQAMADLYTKQAYLLNQSVSGNNNPAVQNQLQQVNSDILNGLVANKTNISSIKQVLAKSNALKSPKNAIIKDIAFDIIVNASGGGRTTTRKLTRCLLTTNEQVWDQSDNVTKDVYGFIGVEIN